MAALKGLLSAKALLSHPSIFLPSPSLRLLLHPSRYSSTHDSDPSSSLSLVTTDDPTIPFASPPQDGSLSHIDAQGEASMVNVSLKRSSKRVAVASGKVVLGPQAFDLVSANQIKKGDVLTVAKVAGILGAKQTSNLIPLCHNITLSDVQVTLHLDKVEKAVNIKAEATAVASTGVEMEALTAVSVASLTIYDMCKAVSKEIKICNIQLDSKTGGKSGDWVSKEAREPRRKSS